jgi:hypothetical protein
LVWMSPAEPPGVAEPEEPPLSNPQPKAYTLDDAHRVKNAISMKLSSFFMVYIPWFL